jgi:hypothetical protein
MGTDYELSPEIYDEAFEEGGAVRPHYAALVDWLDRIDLGRLAADTKRHIRDRNVTFGAAPEGFFNLDPVPRLITADEWSTLSRGVLQRADALDRFMADVYGEREIIAAGVVPARVIEASTHYEPAMRDAVAPPTWITVIGFDVVRAPDGRRRASTTRRWSCSARARRRRGGTNTTGSGASSGSRSSRSRTSSRPAMRCSPASTAGGSRSTSSTSAPTRTGSPTPPGNQPRSDAFFSSRAATAG